MRWADHVVSMTEIRNACKLLVGIPERKKPLCRPRSRWRFNGMDLREIGLGGVDLRIWLKIGIGDGLLLKR
jgi:hypothetical protein